MPRKNYRPQFRLVRPDRAREHLRTLRAAHLHWDTLAALTGVRMDVLTRIYHGRTERIHSDNEARILAARSPAPGAPQKGIVDAGPVRDHLEELTSRRRHMEAVAEEVSQTIAVSGRTLRGIRKGHIASVDTRVADAVLAVQPNWNGDCRRGEVPARATSRIIQGLVAQGFSFTYLASLRGVRHGTMRRWAAESRTAVSTDVADWVREIGDKLIDYDMELMPEPMFGMSKYALNAARRNGWRKLYEWGDADLNDPNAEPMLAFVDDLLVAYHRKRLLAEEGHMINMAGVDYGELNRAEQVELLRQVGRNVTGSSLSRTLAVSGQTARGMLDDAALVEHWLNTGDIPDRLAAAGLGERVLHYAVLAACQNEPYGRAWTSPTLAGWLNIPVDRARHFREQVFARCR